MFSSEIFRFQLRFPKPWNSSQNESPLRGIKGFSRVAAAQLMVRRTGPVDEFHAETMEDGGIFGSLDATGYPKKEPIWCSSKVNNVNKAMAIGGGLLFVESCNLGYGAPHNYGYPRHQLELHPQSKQGMVKNQEKSGFPNNETQKNGN